MSKDLSYLDGIARNALKDVKITSDVSWENVANKMKNGQVANVSNFSKISTFLSSKVALLFAVIIAVSSVTLLFFNVSGDFKASSSAKKIEEPRRNKIENNKSFIVVNEVVEESIIEDDIVEDRNNNENVILAEDIKEEIDSISPPVVVRRSRIVRDTVKTDNK